MRSLHQAYKKINNTFIDRAEYFDMAIPMLFE